MSSPAPQAEGSPAGIAQRQFATARKGYDPHEVRAYLAELSRLVERLQRSEAKQRVRAEEAEALSEVDAGPLDEKRLIELLGEETARVLEAARAAAAEIRRKAEESASRLISEASDQAHRVRTEADESASRVLGDATGEAERVRGEARESADRLVGEATAEAEQLRGDAEDAAARTRREVTDEVNRQRAEAEAAIAAQRIELRSEVESMRREAATELDRRRAEGEALVAEMRREAEEESATLRAAAQEEGRKMVTEAQVVRERMLRDLGRRRRAAREQLERLNAARERLLVAYDVVRRTVDAATGELTVALPEAKVAGEAAMRRAQGEPEPSIEELDDLVAMARIAGLLDPRLEPSILDDDDPPDEPAPPDLAADLAAEPLDPTPDAAAPDPDPTGHAPIPADGAPSGRFPAADRSTPEPPPSGPARPVGHATPVDSGRSDRPGAADRSAPEPPSSGLRRSAGLGTSGSAPLARPDASGPAGLDPATWAEPGPQARPFDHVDDDDLTAERSLASPFRGDVGDDQPEAPPGVEPDDAASPGDVDDVDGVDLDPTADDEELAWVGGLDEVEVEVDDGIDVVTVDVIEVVEDDAVAALREIAALDALTDDEDDEAGDPVPEYDVEPVRWPGMTRPPVAVIDVASAEGPEDLDGEEVDEDPIPVEAEQLALTADEAEVVAEAEPDDDVADAGSVIDADASEGDDLDDLLVEDVEEAASAVAADHIAAGRFDATGEGRAGEGGAEVVAADQADQPDQADDEAGRRRRLQEAALAGRQPAPTDPPAGAGGEGSAVDQLFAQLRAGREAESPADVQSAAPSEPETVAARHAGADPDVEAPTGASGSPDPRRHGDLPHLLDPPAWRASGQTDAGGVPDRDGDAGRDVLRPEPDDDEVVDDDHALTDGPDDDDQAVLRRRDETLAQIEQGLARRLKRILADEQNEVLDLLRRTKQADQAQVDELLPAAESHRSQYGDASRDDLDRAAEAGAQEVAGAASFDGSCDELAAGLAQAVVAPLRERIARSLAEAGPDPEELTNRLRSLYREWKAQRINDAVRHFAVAAYARGAYTGVPEGTALRWVVDRSGDLCPDADDNALAGPVPRGASFPTGDRCPPAHLGCRCLVVPMGEPAGVPVGAPGARGVGLADTRRT